MKIYSKTIAYYCPGKIQVRTSSSGSIRLLGFDGVCKRKTILNLSKQRNYRVY